MNIFFLYISKQNVIFRLNIVLNISGLNDISGKKKKKKNIYKSIFGILQSHSITSIIIKLELLVSLQTSTYSSKPFTSKRGAKGLYDLQ